MPTHRADVPVRTGTPSQIAHPWRATLRTFIQTAVPALVGLVVFAPEILRIVLEQLVPAVEAQWPVLGGQLRAVLAAAAVLVAALAATCSRIMAIGGLEAWLKRWAPWIAALPVTELVPSPDAAPDRLTDEDVAAEHGDVETVPGHPLSP